MKRNYENIREEREMSRENKKREDSDHNHKVNSDDEAEDELTLSECD